MKVVKAPNANWEYKCTCQKCDAELLVETSDLILSKSKGGYGGGDDSYYCYCQVCANQISIPLNQIPKIVKVNVEKKTKSSINPPGGDFRDGPFEDFRDK